MKISEKIQDLVERANKLASLVPNEGKFIALSIFPVGSDGRFQVWFDKWATENFSVNHLGFYLEFCEGSSLPEALSLLEEELIKEGSHPLTIVHDGHTYRRVD